MSNECAIQGKVTIWNGDTIVREEPNHFVDAGLLGFASLMVSSQYVLYLPSHGWKMYLGRDIETPTTHDMTGLVDPIYDGLGVPPTQQAIVVYDGSTTGNWRVIHRAVWQQGIISGDVGEVALYMAMPTKTAFKWTDSSGAAPAVVMVSRLSVADGDFEPYAIDNRYPTVIDWMMDFNFGGISDE